MKTGMRVARDAGFRYVLLVTKHHDGFCLWDSQYTNYDVASSPVKTDVVKAVSDACRKYGLQFGVYYSLWDRHEQSYRDKDPKKYIDYMIGQLRELFLNYGPICELWFDGGWRSRRCSTPRAEFFNTGSGEYIVRKTDLSEEREHGFHLAYLSLVPKFVEHEGVGNNDQHQSSRIQQIVGFPAKIELRRAAIEVEIVGRITEQQVEAKAGIVVSQVASFDMGLRIEVSGYRNSIGIDIETVGIVEIRKMVHEVADSATHIEYHLRRIG